MRPRPKQTLIRPVTTLPNDICGFLLEMVIFCGVETFQRVWNAYLSISLFHGGQEGNKELLYGRPCRRMLGMVGKIYRDWLKSVLQV